MNCIFDRGDLRRKLIKDRPAYEFTGAYGASYARVFFEKRADIYGDDDKLKLKPEIAAEPWLIIHAPAWRYYRFDLEGESVIEP